MHRRQGVCKGEWIEESKSGQTRLMYEERSRRPTISTTDKKIEQVGETVMAHPQQFRNGSASQILSSASTTSVQGGYQETLLQASSGLSTFTESVQQLKVSNFGTK